VIENEAGVDVDGDVVVEGEVLTVLKALEPIDDDFPGEGSSLEISGLVEHAVPAKTSNVMGHRGGGAVKGTGDLAVGHTTDDHREDVWDEPRALLPVGGREGL
jgi:hypothetical protein